jgi:hypothetical protein
LIGGDAERQLYFVQTLGISGRDALVKVDAEGKPIAEFPFSGIVVSETGPYFLTRSADTLLVTHFGADGPSNASYYLTPEQSARLDGGVLVGHESSGRLEIGLFDDVGRCDTVLSLIAPNRVELHPYGGKGFGDGILHFSQWWVEGNGIVHIPVHTAEGTKTVSLKM